MLECDINAQLIKQAEEKAACLIDKLKELSLKLVLAESCTAGLVSSFMANVPGASGVLYGSFVCYTQDAKVSMLNLNRGKLEEHGLVSGETACSMVKGALEKSGADIAASVTGLAGPNGDGSGVPVGTVWVAAAKQNGGIEAKEHHFTGERNEVRIKAAIAVFEALDTILKNQ